MDEAFVEQAAVIVEKIEAEATAPFNRLMDLSKIDAVDVTFSFAFRMALHRRMVAAKQAPVKLAYYVTSPATKRIARTHAMLTERSPSDVRMFYKLEPAAEWLGVAVEDLELFPTT